MNLTYFKELNLVQSTERLFEELGIPLIVTGHTSSDWKDFLEHAWKKNETFELIEKVTWVGSVDRDFLPPPHHHHQEQYI